MSANLKRIIFYVSFSIFCVFIAFTIFSCKDNSTNPVTKTPLAAITDLKAYSVNQSSVGLIWTPSVDENQDEFDKYTITAVPATGNSLDTTTLNSYIVMTGLTEGMVYTFNIISTATADAKKYSDSQPENIKWSPARRLNYEGGTTIPIQIGEKSSTSYPSGLILYSSGVISGPRTVSIVGADSNDIDLYVDTLTNNGISLKSYHLFHLGTGKHITRFSDTIRTANSLDDPRLIPPDTTTYKAGNYVINFDSVSVSTSKIIYFKSNDGNYGRILIERDSNTERLIWGTSPDQYLKIIISYQTMPNNPYSKTAIVKP